MEAFYLQYGGFFLNFQLPGHFPPGYRFHIPPGRFSPFAQKQDKRTALEVYPVLFSLEKLLSSPKFPCRNSLFQSNRKPMLQWQGDSFKNRVKHFVSLCRGSCFGCCCWYCISKAKRGERSVCIPKAHRSIAGQQSLAQYPVCQCNH